MKLLLRIAVFCGIIPLVVGLSIVAAYVAWKAEWLISAGFLTIEGGILVVVIGTVCLVIHVWRSWRSRAIPRRRIAWQAAAVLLLYVANFLAAGGALIVGANVKFRPDPAQIERDRRSSPLIGAAMGGDVERAAVLLGEGADIHYVTDRGHGPPLVIAAECGRENMVAFLLAHGADPNKGVPLAPAARYNRVAIVCLLLDAGADRNAKWAGWTPLELAVRHGNTDVVKLLQEYYPDATTRPSIDVRGVPTGTTEPFQGSSHR